MLNLLIVDDEKYIRKILAEILTPEGYVIDEAVDGAEGWNKFFSNNYHAVLCDVKMPKMDGLAFLAKAKELNAEVPIIMISSLGDVESAVDAVKRGAFDYIPKPPDLNRLLITLKNATEKFSLIKSTKKLKHTTTHIQPIIGNSNSIKNIHTIINKVAPTDARVLITGESGTGKELVARWIHEKSNRNNFPFIEINCAAIPSELIESELFGHEKGSFTSAIKQRIGKFEQANNGTLFLDEIGDMSLSAQSKVLRALQEKKITRVGGEKEIEVNVRVLAATNKNLLSEIQQHQFRLDLYHRLSIVIIQVPSLKDRNEDIPILANHFLKQISIEYGQEMKTIDDDAIAVLMQYQWSGNIRELRNVMERLFIFSDKNITAYDIQNNVLLM